MRSSRLAASASSLAFLVLSPYVGTAEPTASTCPVGGQSVSVVVTYAQSAPHPAESVTLRLDYPPTLVSLPGTGASPELGKRLGTQPANTVVGVSNAPAALRLVATRAQGFDSGDLVTVRFDRCRGADTPQSGDFHCTVEGAATRSGPVPDPNCTVRLAQ